jgi:soluble cytochrome b562
MSNAALYRLAGRAGRLGVVAGLMGISAFLVVLTSCSKPKTHPQAAVQPRTGPPVLHAVYAKELRQEMRDLNAQASQEVYLRVYTGGPPVVDMQNVASVADRMAQVAAKLPQAVANVQMEPKEREIYEGLAKRLHDQAVTLKHEADANNLDGARAAMSNLTTTCNTCHTMFRGVAGPVD